MQRMPHYTNLLFLFLLFHTYTVYANRIAIAGYVFGAKFINEVIQLWFPDESHLQMQREFSVSPEFVKRFFPCQELGIKKLLEQAAEIDLENMKAPHIQKILGNASEQSSEQEQNELLRNVAPNLLATYRHYSNCCKNEFSDQQQASIKSLADNLYNELRVCLHKKCSR
ncbi:hypothetical protein KJZ61_03430 [Candidatus Dependentiae bacterium]|nr:hypothetical protein [Candidatus Dependentiae bacterium]